MSNKSNTDGQDNQKLLDQISMLEGGPKFLSSLNAEVERLRELESANEWNLKQLFTLRDELAKLSMSADALASEWKRVAAERDSLREQAKEQREAL